LQIKDGINNNKLDISDLYPKYNNNKEKPNNDIDNLYHQNENKQRMEILIKNKIKYDNNKY